MPACEERKIDIPGFTIALKIWNPEKSSPVLCLHGKMDNAASFDLLAPFFSDRQIVAVDYPGTGFSTFYPEGIMPHWKNDAYIMLHVIKAMGWKTFDIIAHSLGSLLATILAIIRPEQVRKMFFLDVLGPTANLIENGIVSLQQDIETWLSVDCLKRTLFSSQEIAIHDRMKRGNISYQAAQALVIRGTTLTENSFCWTFDRRLRCVNSTLPHEDELRRMFAAINVPICLVRASHGITYTKNLFQERAACIKNLVVHKVDGGHHVHMDNPAPVAAIISQYLHPAIR